MVASKLFTPLTLGGKKSPLQLNHRVVMAPLTRLKAGADGVQPDMAVTYYSQRATDGGLIIAEATDISETARGYFGAPGVHSSKQMEAWKKVTSAVHAKNGTMFVQLWHTGRISHPSNQPDDQLPVSSSSRMDTTTGRLIPTAEGRVPHVAPRALKTEEIPDIVADFKKATANALASGFDGVELHCANGYLMEQFLHDGINDRTDRYGGSVENRARIIFEVLDAMLEVIDSSRLGIRFSPYSLSFGQHDSNPLETYRYVLNKLNTYDLAYVHLIEPRGFSLHESPQAPKGGMVKLFRPLYDGVLIAASGYDRDLADEVLNGGDADLVAFGRYFISNADLVKRLRLNAPLNSFDEKTFYLPGAEGYLGQPLLEEDTDVTA